MKRQRKNKAIEFGQPKARVAELFCALQKRAAEAEAETAAAAAAKEEE